MTSLWFRGGAILTMDRARPHAETLLVEDGLITALDAPQPEGATVVDLAGGALLPGFIDPHHHYCLAALDRRTPDLHLPPGSTMSDLLATVERFVREAPGTGWIRVQGFEPVKLREGRAPTRRELDEICPHRPLLVIAYSVHDGVLNSAGLAAMGWSSPRDGRVSEAQLFLAEARSRDALLERSEDAWLVEAEAHGRALLAAGIVRVGDAAVPPLFERLYERAAAEGDCLSRSTACRSAGARSSSRASTRRPPARGRRARRSARPSCCSTAPTAATSASPSASSPRLRPTRSAVR